ncbi:MAG TPA: hypothetical protein VKS79_20210 [Gemmataceae bacterium]|nr:hypothetical protein [Gemmataceae bacterium]
MIRHLIGPGMMAVLCFTAAAHAEDKWETYTSKSGKYSILMPAKPTESDQKFESNGVELKQYLAMVAPSGSDLVYLVAYNDFPEAAIAGADKELMLDSVRDGGAKTFGGKIVSDKKITLGKEKYAGREFVAEKSDESRVYRSRAYVAGSRLYQIVIIAPKDVATNKETDKYFDSFKLGE